MINKVTLVGSLGRDAEQKQVSNGQQVVNFSMATNESYQDKGGNWQQKTEWHDITAWGSLVDRAIKLKKGDLLYLEGKIQNRSYQDKQGNNQKDYRVVAKHFRIIKAAATAPAEGASVKGDEDLPW